MLKKIRNEELEKYVEAGLPVQTEREYFRLILLALLEFFERK